MKHVQVLVCFVMLMLAVFRTEAQTPQGTTFSYQGELRQNNSPVTANVDMTFMLFDAATNGNQLPPTLSFTAATSNPVAVSDGIFTVTLDFGPAFGALISDQRWLQVTVNGNVLSPRTQIQNAPYAIQSQTAELAFAISNSSVGSAQIVASQVQARVSGNCAVGSSIRAIAQDGAVTCQTDTNSGGSVTNVGTDATLTGGPITTSGTLGIASGAVGSGQINSAQVQVRVSGTCDATQKVLGINADGSVNCSADLTGSGGGTVTNVATDATLTGGPITTTGVLGIASGGVGLAQINTAQVQARVSATCSLGSYLRGLNANGSPICTPLVPQPLALDQSGGYVSIAIGADGYPVLSFFDDTSMSLKVAKCSDAACSASTISTVDTGNVGQWTSIAIGTDTFPVISYFDVGNSHVKTAKCVNTGCTSAATIRTFDSSNSATGFTSIAIAPTGFPVISFQGDQVSSPSLKLVRCGSSNCTSGSLTTLDHSGDVGEFTSVAVGADNRPVVSYFDVVNHTLKLAKCDVTTCQASGLAAVTIHTVDATAMVGEWTSIALGSDTFPVISYLDYGNGHLKVAKCVDAGCAAAATIHTVDSAVDVGEATSIAIGNDTFPVISYFDYNFGSVRLVKCGDTACASATKSLIDPVASGFTSVAIGADSMPVIGYAGSGQVKIAKCNSTSCR